MEDALAAALADRGEFEEVIEEADGSDYIDDGIETSIDAGAADWLPAATFDALVLINELRQYGEPGRLEVHTFAYLACLMSVFKGAPVSEWNYAFTAVPPTLPFSPTLESALSALLLSGKTEQVDLNSGDGLYPSFALTTNGEADLNLLRSLRAFAPRLPYLQAAAKTAVFTSVHAVVNSVNFEPQLVKAVSLDRPRVLLNPVGASSLYEEFDALTRVLGPEHEELLVPASLYVSFLQERARHLAQSAHAGDLDE